MVKSATRIGRLSLQFGTAFALAMAAVGVGMYLFATDQIQSRVDVALQQDRLLLTGTGFMPARMEMARRIAALEEAHPASSRGHVIFDARHRLVYGHLRMADPGPGYSDLVYSDLNSTRRRHGRALGVAMPGGDRLVIYAHSELIENIGDVLLPLMLGLIAASALGGLGVTQLLGLAIGKRLQRTIHAADAIAGGDWTRRVPLDQLDGVFRAHATSFNRMLDRLEDMNQTQRQFSSNLAHDLRSPLTRLRGLLVRGAQQASDPGEACLVEAAERECASIIAIFDALLRLSEIEAGSHPVAMEPVRLRPLIEDVIETMEPVLADQRIALVIADAQEVRALADADLLVQMLVNMLENVAHHTPAGTRAAVSLRRGHDGGALLVISDDGPGLGECERSRLLRPFQRGQSTGGARGSGLGLAIAQAIVRFHRGEISLRDNHPGLRVEIRLPAIAG